MADLNRPDGFSLSEGGGERLGGKVGMEVTGGEKNVGG